MGMHKIDTTEQEKLIEEAVDIREKGDHLTAIEMLSKVVKFTWDQNIDDVCARALSERIVCHKHLYELQGLTDSLDDMYRDIGLGLQLNLSPHDQSVFLLRKGDYNSFKGNFQIAEDNYQCAYNRVNKGGRAEAEYLGHLGEAKANNCDPANQSDTEKLITAVALIEKAIEIVNNNTDKNFDRKQRMIVLSGLYLRLMDVHRKHGQPAKVHTAEIPCFRLCRELKLRHGYPLRMQQLSLRLQNIGT